MIVRLGWDLSAGGYLAVGILIGLVLGVILGWAMASMCAAAKRGDEAAQEAWRKAQTERKKNNGADHDIQNRPGAGQQDYDAD